MLNAARRRAIPSTATCFVARHRTRCLVHWFFTDVGRKRHATTQPAPDQVRGLMEQLIDIQRQGSRLKDEASRSRLTEAMREAYGTSNDYALLLMAVYCADRFRAMQDFGSDVVPGAGLDFPRRLLLDAAPAGLSEDVHAACVQLIENALGDDQTALENGVVAVRDRAGFAAFQDLVLLCTMLGRMHVDGDPALSGLLELVHREAQQFASGAADSRWPGSPGHRLHLGVLWHVRRTLVPRTQKTVQVPGPGGR